mmetsp:Transcript_41911/g.98271  ORF Transcript_41911/g.98271 Transcript_41911/m.98271 type:complete len:81 (+) Transcript_41911:2588-2830(+)
MGNSFTTGAKYTEDAIASEDAALARDREVFDEALTLSFLLKRLLFPLPDDEEEPLAQVCMRSVCEDSVGTQPKRLLSEPD